MPSLVHRFYSSVTSCFGGLSAGIGMHKTSRWFVTIVGFILVSLAVWYLRDFSSNNTLAISNPNAPEYLNAKSVSSFRHINASSIENTQSVAEPTIEPTAEPTTRPSHTPTTTHSNEPSVEPSAEPSAEPTADPTVADSSIAPSVLPSTLPSVNPTIQPSRPTVRPSKTPTIAPTKTPTTKPSLRTTPIPGSPTARPTASSQMPTTKPTIDPYPVETLLVFNNSIRCDNIDSFTFYDDPRIEIAFVSTFASTMQSISTDMVRVVNVTDVAGVRRLSTINSLIEEKGKEKLSTQVKSLHEVDTHHSNMHTLASSISIVLQEASADIVDNDFAATLASELLSLGITSSITPISNSYRATSFSIVVLQTAQPSVAPTLSPSMIGLSVADSSRGGTTVVDIIVIITVIGSVAMLLGLLYGAHYEKEKVKQNKLKIAPLPGQSVTSIVPGP
eukprot:gene12687-14660_t